jgi:hypothetical protein
MSDLKRFLGNLILYSGIALALYVLYAPGNKHVNNKTHSAIQFVYQQF